MAETFRLTGKNNPENVDVTMPSEGELFRIPIGTGGSQLATIKGNTIYTLGAVEKPPLTEAEKQKIIEASPWKHNPTLLQAELDNAIWRGRQAGDWVNDATLAGLSALGLSADKVPEVNIADFQSFKQAKGLTEQDLADINAFKQYVSQNQLFETRPAQYTANPTGLSLDQIKNPNSDTLSRLQKEAPKWVDPTTGQMTAAGVGMPSNPLGVQISNETDLEAKRQILRQAGIKDSEFSKYITTPNQDPTGKGRLFFKEPVKLTSPNGQTKTVALGSTEANQLLKSGWTTGSGVNDGVITSPLLSDETDLNIAANSSSNTYLADTTYASAKADISAAEKEIARLQALLTPPETALSKQVSEMMKQLSDDANTLTGRGAMQIAEEEKRQIEQQTQQIQDRSTELSKKLAEIEALTASYNLANQEVEGKPITLARMQGQQAQNYKMYMAQKNMLTAEAGYIQAELLGMQGKLQAAQSAADRAVELEYMDRESAYNAKLAQLSILQTQLDKEEANYANAVQLYLQQQADALAEQKAEKTNIQNVKLQAISSGITDASVLTRIGNAKTYDEALQILGENMPKETGDNITTDYKNYLLAGGESSGMTFAEWLGKSTDDIDTRKISSTQYQAATYATRMENSNIVIDELGSDFTGGLGYLTGSKFFPNILKSENRQKYEQAQRDFVNAVLRRESGAAIADSEFESARQQYFPQPGDSESVIKQKAFNRQTAIQGLKNEAGDAYRLLQSTQDPLQINNDDPLNLGFSVGIGIGTSSNAQKIASAIRQVESGGNYQAKGGSGEYGAYQFMPSTWSGWAKQYLGNANAPMTKENQDKVALAKIQDLINQGYNAQEIALIWNGGSPTIKSGINKYGIKYDTGAYAKKVINALNNLA